jgi:dipeptidase E
MSKRLMLLSNSTMHGQDFLDHAAGEIQDFLGQVESLVFVPFAQHDRDAYAALVRTRFEKMGIEAESLHDVDDEEEAVENAEAIFIGGGNTFLLLSTLHQLRLIEPIRRRVEGGMPFLGSSAGTNVACPTIRTTNDMPIIEPPSFEALALIPFQINPHYLDPDPGSRHMGETREQRIREFHLSNQIPVLGIREGAWLSVEAPHVELGGLSGARLFQYDKDPEEYEPGASLDFLLRVRGQ